MEYLDKKLVLVPNLAFKFVTEIYPLFEKLEIQHTRYCIEPNEPMIYIEQFQNILFYQDFTSMVILIMNLFLK